MTNFEHFKQNFTIFDLIAITCRQRCIHCPAREFCETVNNPCNETLRLWAVQEYEKKLDKS